MGSAIAGSAGAVAAVGGALPGSAAAVVVGVGLAAARRGCVGRLTAAGLCGFTERGGVGAARGWGAAMGAACGDGVDGVGSAGAGVANRLIDMISGSVCRTTGGWSSSSHNATPCTARAAAAPAVASPRPSHGLRCNGDDMRSGRQDQLVGRRKAQAVLAPTVHDDQLPSPGEQRLGPIARRGGGGGSCRGAAGDRKGRRGGGWGSGHEGFGSGKGYLSQQTITVVRIVRNKNLWRVSCQSRDVPGASRTQPLKNL